MSPLRKKSAIRRIGSLLKSGCRKTVFGLRYAVRNRRFATAPQRFLVVRHCEKPYDYDIVIDWAQRHFPELRSLFELQLLPCRCRDWSRYVLHIPWLRDPVQRWSEEAYAQANRLAAECDCRRIPIINRVDKLTNASKLTAAKLLAGAGLRTARAIPIENVEEFRETALGLNLPLIVREEWGHGQLMLKADSPADLRNIPLERFIRPIAVEHVDVQSAHDGLFRKHRYVAVGDEGITLSMHISKNWITRGKDTEFNDRLRDEEAAYIDGSDPHHELLQRGRRALELDFVAFDYGYDRAGRMVVWEANPMPLLHFPGGRRLYRTPPVERTLAAMFKLYLERADLPVPASIQDLVARAGQRSTSGAGQHDECSAGRAT